MDIFVIRYKPLFWSVVWAASWRFALAAVVLPAFFIIPAGMFDYKHCRFTYI